MGMDTTRSATQMSSGMPIGSTHTIRSDTAATRTLDSASHHLRSNNDTSCESDESRFLRTPPKRSSLSTIKLALAVVKGEDVDVDEHTQKKIAMLDEETPAKPFKRLSSARKLQVQWPPIAIQRTDEKKKSSKKTVYLSPKSASSATAPITPTSFEEMHSVLESASSMSSLSCKDVFGESSPKRTGGAQKRGIKEKIDLYESLCHKSSIREGFHRHRPSCPGDFDCDLYPTMKLRDTYLDDSQSVQSNDHEDIQDELSNVSLSPGHNLPQPTGCRKHRRVSYRIRFAIPDLDAIHPNDGKQCYSEETEEASTERVSGPRGVGIRGICGFNRSDQLVTWGESRMESKIDKDVEEKDPDGDIASQNEASLVASDNDDDSEARSEISFGDLGFHRPEVWLTPIKSKDGSRKWIAKRFWDIEDKDDEEPEYELEHWCLMHGVRGLMGIPEEMGMTSDEWDVSFVESNPWERTATNDFSPNLPRRSREDNSVRAAQLFVKTVIDVDGTCEDSTSSLPLDEENFDAQLLHITNLPSLNEKLTDKAPAATLNNITEHSIISDFKSDVSLLSLMDYFDGSDTSSVSASMPTQSVDDDASYQLPSDNESGQGQPFESSKISIQHERGFGRPDVWVRPKYVQNESPESSKRSHHNERGFGRPDEWVKSTELFEEASETPKVSSHKERGFGRPDEWVRPHDTSGEYLESTKSNHVKQTDELSRSNNACKKSSESEESGDNKSLHHNQRGFGRPDEWVKPNDLYEGSTEGQSGRSAELSRTAHDKAETQSSPEDDSMHRSLGSLVGPKANPNPLDECKNLIEGSSKAENNIKEDCKDGKATEYKGEKYLAQIKTPKRKNKKNRGRSLSPVLMKTQSTKYDSDDEYNRGTPTWEKRALEQDENESNIELWWQLNKKNRGRSSSPVLIKTRNMKHSLDDECKRRPPTWENSTFQDGEADPHNKSWWQLDDEDKRGTPTWEKRAFQQGEEEPNIRLWWQI